jgi:hypothetical protein
MVPLQSSEEGRIDSSSLAVSDHAVNRFVPVLQAFERALQLRPEFVEAR